jgi:hypothetical protein
MPCERRHHRGEAIDSLYVIGFAGPDRWAGYRRQERRCNEVLAAPSSSNRRDVDGIDGGITRPWEALRSSQVGP